MSKWVQVILFVVCATFLSISVVSAGTQFNVPSCWVLSNSGTSIDLNCDGIIDFANQVNSSLYYNQSQVNSLVAGVTANTSSLQSQINDVNSTVNTHTSQISGIITNVSAVNSTAVTALGIANGAVITANAALPANDQRYNDTALIVSVNNSFYLYLGNYYNKTQVDALITAVNTTAALSNYYNISQIDSQQLGQNTNISAVNTTAQSGLSLATAANGTATSTLSLATTANTTANSALSLATTANSTANAALPAIDQRYNDTALINAVNKTPNIMLLGFYNQSQVDALISAINSTGNFVNYYNKTTIDSIVSPINSTANSALSLATTANTTANTATSNIAALNSSKVDKTATITITNTPMFINGVSSAQIQNGFNLSMTQSNTTVGGFLTSVDWNTFNGKYNSSNPSGYQNASQVNTTVVQALATTTYLPTSVILAAGTSGTGNNIGNLTLRDGQTYNVSNAFDIKVNFTNVTNFNDVRLYLQYTATTASHYCEFSLWDYNTSSYQAGYMTFSNMNGYEQFDISVNDPENHILNGTVQARIVMITAAGTNDKISIDQLNLLQGLISPSTTATNPVVGFNTSGTGDNQTLTILRYDGVSYQTSVNYAYKANQTDLNSVNGTVTSQGNQISGMITNITAVNSTANSALSLATTANTTAINALPKAGGSMTGNITFLPSIGQILFGNGGGVSWNSTDSCLISPANSTNARNIYCVTQPLG